jgi:hypothetical protein
MVSIEASLTVRSCYLLIHPVEAGVAHREATACCVALLLYPVLKHGWSAAETPYPKKVLLYRKH